MTQNGLKWILNTTLKSVKFCWSDPPPGMKNFTLFFNEGFPYSPRFEGYHVTMATAGHRAMVNATNSQAGRGRRQVLMPGPTLTISPQVSRATENCSHSE